MRRASFERFIGLDRIAFDENGDVISGEPTDEPQWLPSTGRKGQTGWKKLVAKTQSRGAADDSLRTYATFPEGADRMEFAFDGVREIHAFRLIWSDLGMDVHRGVKGGPIRYRIERCENGVWSVWLDASQNDRDLTVDYREAPAAQADAVRLVLLSAPKGITPGVTEFTVFGKHGAADRKAR